MLIEKKIELQETKTMTGQTKTKQRERETIKTVREEGTIKDRDPWLNKLQGANVR